MSDEFVIDEGVAKQLDELANELQPLYPEVNVKKAIYIEYKRIWDDFVRQGISDKELLKEKTLLKINVLFKKLKDKAILKKMMGGGNEWVGVLLAEGQSVDNYAQLIREIDLVCDKEGESSAMAKGMIEIEGGRRIYKDFRRYIGDRENPDFGKRIDDIPPEKRWRRKFFGVVRDESGAFIPMVWYPRGDPKVNVPLFVPIRFRGIVIGNEGGYIRISSPSLNFVILDSVSKPTDKDIIELFKLLKPFTVPFSKIREKYQEWYISKSETKAPGIIVSEADVWSIEELTNTYRLTLIDGLGDENVEPIFAFLPKDKLNFGEGSRIIFLASMFETERRYGEEVVKDISLKIISHQPIELYSPNTTQFPPLPEEPKGEGEVVVSVSSNVTSLPPTQISNPTPDIPIQPNTQQNEGGEWL